MATSKIKSIEPVEFKIDQDSWHTYDGWIIKTDLDTYKLGICNIQQCCEDWGYYSTPDDTEDFVGAILTRVEVVDKALNNKPLEAMYNADAMFVNFYTDRGILQFTVYNAHNGWYSHDAVLISKEKNYSASL